MKVSAAKFMAMVCAATEVASMVPAISVPSENAQISRDIWMAMGPIRAAFETRATALRLARTKQTEPLRP